MKDADFWYCAGSLFVLASGFGAWDYLVMTAALCFLVGTVVRKERSK